MPVTGIPVVLVPNGMPVTPATKFGMPVTIVGGNVVVLTSGQALEVPVTGTYTDTATVTVEDGVITGIVLS